MTTIGIDIGASKVAAALVKNGRILRFKKSALDQKDSAAVLRQVLKCLEAVRGQGKFFGIGIGVPCAIDQRGIIIACANIPALHTERIVKAVSARYRVPVFRENDVKAAALSEVRYGIGRKSKNFVFVAFGTGIGGAIVIDGKLYKGASGLAGEFGHMPMPVNWEKTASVKLFKRQRKHWVKNAARGLLAITYAIGPEYIVIGGGLASLWDQRLEKELTGAMKKMAFSRNFVLPKIVRARFSDKAGALGAALLPK